MFFMHLYRNVSSHHVFMIRRNHSLKSPKLNHNISYGCRQGVRMFWPFLSNPKCIVDSIHLNMLFQRLFDVSFVNPQHFSNTFTTTNWWTRGKYTYNVSGSYNLSLLWTYQVTSDPRFHVVRNFWFRLIDCRSVRYSWITFCRIKWLKNFSKIKCWMEGSKPLVSFRAIVASFLAILAVTFCGCLS